jgi:hypothetical protein
LQTVPTKFPNIGENQAFILSDPAMRKLYDKAYVDSSALYYGGKPTFYHILQTIGTWIDRL